MRKHPTPNKTLKYEEQKYFSQEDHKDKEKRRLSTAAMQGRPLPKKKKRSR